MSLLTKPKTWADNENVLFTDLNSVLDTLYNDYNGSITNDNISASAAIALSKLAAMPATLTGSETLTNKTLTAPRVNVGSDAQGDIYFRNSSGQLARLAPGVSGQFLKTQGAAADPAWATVPIPAVSVAETGSLGITVAAGNTDDAGSCTITITETSNILITATVQMYANPSSGFGSSADLRLRRDSTDLDQAYRHGLFNSNVRFTTTISFVDKDVPPGTYEYKLRFSANNNEATIEAGTISALATTA